MAGFKTGILIGALLVGVPAGWLIYQMDNQPLMFNSAYVGVTADHVRVTGSVVGSDTKEADRPVNNGVVMTCWRPDSTCRYIQINEIGPNHVGQPVDENLYVRKWDRDELVADSSDLSSLFDGCNYYEIRILFASKDVTYTRLPNPKADKQRCARLFENSRPFRQWRIADGKAWGNYVEGED